MLDERNVLVDLETRLPLRVVSEFVRQQRVIIFSPIAECHAVNTLTLASVEPVGYGVESVDAAAGIENGGEEKRKPSKRCHDDESSGESCHCLPCSMPMATRKDVSDLGS